MSVCESIPTCRACGIKIQTDFGSHTDTRTLDALSSSTTFVVNSYSSTTRLMPLSGRSRPLMLPVDRRAVS